MGWRPEPAINQESCACHVVVTIIATTITINNFIIINFALKTIMINVIIVLMILKNIKIIA